MADLIIRGIEPQLLERIRCIAIARGWTFREAVAKILERGLFMDDYEVISSTHSGSDALADAIATLEKFPESSSF